MQLKALDRYVVMETSGHIYITPTKISPNVTLHEFAGDWRFIGWSGLKVPGENLPQKVSISNKRTSQW